MHHNGKLKAFSHLAVPEYANSFAEWISGALSKRSAAKKLVLSFRAFSNVDAFTAPLDAVSNENWKMQLPAMKIADFNFSSVTRF
jgi:hypothetical protein